MTITPSSASAGREAELRTWLLHAIATQPVRPAAFYLECHVQNFAILALLSLAALLEVAGDALVRAGLYAPSLSARIGFMAAGAVVLFTYGVSVNLPPWDFGRLLGIYVALFFVAAQLVNLFAFGIRPGLPIYAGGALIVSGGLLITFWRA